MYPVPKMGGQLLREDPGDPFAGTGRAILYLEGIVSSRMFSSLMKPQANL